MACLRAPKSVGFPTSSYGGGTYHLRIPKDSHVLARRKHVFARTAGCALSLTEPVAIMIGGYFSDGAVRLPSYLMEHSINFMSNLLTHCVFCYFLVRYLYVFHDTPTSVQRRRQRATVLMKANYDCSSTFIANINCKYQCLNMDERECECVINYIQD